MGCDKSTMNEKKREGAFFPCGDSLEGMQEFRMTRWKAYPAAKRRGQVCIPGLG